MAATWGVGARKGPALSIRHLLSFEVASAAPPVGAQPAARRPAARTGRSGGPLTSERFIHANFRFVARCPGADGALQPHVCTAIACDPDQALEWADVERVLVPTAQDAVCPICLDQPVAPRLTRCGHFFCWPCILRYAETQAPAGRASSESSPAAAGFGPGWTPAAQWHKCPVCVESINVRALRSVHFVHVPDYSSATRTAKAAAPDAALVIPMVLLVRDAGSTLVRRMEPDSDDSIDAMEMSTDSTCSNASSASAARRFSDSLEHCPFAKVRWADRSAAVRIAEADAAELRAHLATLASDDPDREYVRAALSITNERRRAVAAEASVPAFPLNGATEAAASACCQGEEAPGGHAAAGRGSQQCPCQNDVSADTGHPSESSVFFHQAADGQPYFLSPLTIRMLRSAFSAYAGMPRALAAPVVEMEHIVVTEDVRRKHKHLGHLPLGAQIALCELDLADVVPGSVLEQHAHEIEKRAAVRRGKAEREAHEDAQRQRRVDEERQRLLDATAAVRTIPSAFVSAADGGPSRVAVSYEEEFPLPPPVGATQPIAVPAVPSQSAPGGAGAAGSLGSGVAGSFASILSTSPGASHGPSSHSASAFRLSFDDLALASPVRFYADDDASSGTDGADRPCAGKPGAKKTRRRVLLASTSPRRNIPH